VRFFNEFAYTQVALYGKSFTRASRDTWALLVHHSGVDALVQRDLVTTALTFGALLSGLTTALVVSLWARATLDPQAAADAHPISTAPTAASASGMWWEAIVAAFAIGYGAVSLVSAVIEAGVCALYVCYAEDPNPLANTNPALYSLFISRPHAISFAAGHSLLSAANASSSVGTLAPNGGGTQCKLEVYQTDGLSPRRRPHVIPHATPPWGEAANEELPPYDATLLEGGKYHDPWASPSIPGKYHDPQSEQLPSAAAGPA